MNEPSVHGPKRRPLGPAGWLAILVLGCILAASIWFAFYGWNLTDGQISTQGMIALVLGVVFSMLLGGGLMALVFWSNKKGYDR
jgi:TRAP-type C4-dicarboxylate transport system permease small subunit